MPGAIRPRQTKGLFKATPPKLLGASVPPALVGSSLAPAADALNLVRVDAPPGEAFDGVNVIVVTAGATLTAGRNWLSVYHPDGTLLGQSRDQTTIWTTAGQYDTEILPQAGQSLAVPQDGYVYVGFQSAGTTRPAFGRVAHALAAALPAGSDSRRGFTMAGAVSLTAGTPPVFMPRLSLQPPGLSGTFYAGLIGAVRTEVHRPVPHGHNSGNLQVKDNKLFYRVAARETGYLQEFAIQTATSSTRGASYVGGTYGTWRCRWYPAGAGGLPDMSGSPLGTVETFNPNTRELADSLTYGTADSELIVLQPGFRTVEGKLYCLVIDNTDPTPNTNYASCNFLYVQDGLKGAQARNELNPLAADVYYGVDPREGIGEIWADGSVHFPCGSTVDPTVMKHVPTFVQGYPGGRRYGQPYYSASDIAAGAVSTTWRVPDLTRVTAIGCHMGKADSFTASLVVNGTTIATAPLATAGVDGGYVEGAITPTLVGPGDVVKVTATTTVLGSLKSIYPGASLKTYWLQRSNRPFTAVGTTNLDQVYDADTTRSVPLFPVGWPLVR